VRRFARPVRYSHVALYAADLRAAEEFYASAFAADLLFRESRDTDGFWHTLPLEATWEDAERAGIEIHFVALARDAIVFPIFEGERGPRIVGLKLDAEELDAVRDRLPGEAVVVAQGERTLVFRDPFEVEWQLATVAGFRSSGELHGRWLRV
jgi:catechol 2,3-dioxygenase-like lactoylglutathione lyase family enzyme